MCIDSDHILLLVLAGSRAYGTHSTESDADYRGVVAASREMLVGLKPWDTQIERHRPEDVVLYTLPKFVRLALRSNPNILDTLFCTDDLVLESHPIGIEIRTMAPQFLSKRVYHTFVGYAHGQLSRLRTPSARHGTHQKYVEAFGYDTKNAMHLVRLYRMGYEALTEGVVRVRRPDADELLAIKNGAWSFEEIERFAMDMERKCAQAYKRSILPDTPNEKDIVEWLMDTQERMLCEGKFE